jgi:hypothetical protein
MGKGTGKDEMYGSTPFRTAVSSRNLLRADQMKGQIMLNTLANFARLFENYRYYRNLGIDILEAWRLAKVTLPD